jgi:hypothetical protein
LGYFLGLEAGEQNVAIYIGQSEEVQSLRAAKNRKRGQVRTGQGRTGQDWAGRGRQGRTGQNRAGQGRTRQDRTGQKRTRQDSAGQDRTGQDPPERRNLRLQEELFSVFHQ